MDKKKIIVIFSSVLALAIIIIGVLVGTAQMRKLRNNIDSGHKYLIEEYWRETTVSLNKDITALRKLAEEEGKKQAFMQKVYDAMVAEDYAKMCEFDGSDEAKEIVKLIEGNNYVYIPSVATGGIGVVLCKYGNGGYYFYYGNIVNGVKSGKGTAFISYNCDTYRVMTGSWRDDAPNGANTIVTVGGIFRNNGGQFNKTCSGNMINGLWDGKVDDKLVDSQGYAFDLSYEATMGIPTVDKTAEFLSEFDANEDGYVYAYDEVQVQGGRRYVYSSRGNKDDTLGWYGFADPYL